MQCERRLYGISGIAFYRVGKTGCLRRSPACESAAKAHCKGAKTRCCVAVVSPALQNLEALLER